MLALGRAGPVERQSVCQNAGPHNTYQTLLHQLDIVLERAVARARITFGDEQKGQFRGLFIGEDEINDLVEQTDRSTLGSHSDVSDAVEEFLATAAFAVVGAHWGLSRFDYGVLVLALAPELDLRYERIYAYLQDDVTKHRPTVDLALNLFCTEWTERLAERQRFAPDAPLIKSGLLKLTATNAATNPPLLTRFLQLDDRVARALIGDDALDTQLVSYCQRIRASIGASRPDYQTATARQLVRYATLPAQERARPLRLLFSGPATSAKREAATGFADELGKSLLIADLAKSSEWRSEPTTVAMLLLREATLSNAILYLDGLPEGAADNQAISTLMRVLAPHPGIIVIATDLTAVPDFDDDHGILRVAFQLPEYRGASGAVATADMADWCPISPDTLNKLSATFQLAPEQIEAAAAIVTQRLNWRVSQGDSTEEAEIAKELFAAARGQGGEELAALTSKVAPVYRWSDIVLPEDSIEQLHELCSRVRFRHAVLERGGFGRKLSSGKGITALFAGPSGAGKTMAAEVVANELGLDLFRVERRAW